MRFPLVRRSRLEWTERVLEVYVHLLDERTDRYYTALIDYYTAIEPSCPPDLAARVAEMRTRTETAQRELRERMEAVA